MIVVDNVHKRYLIDRTPGEWVLQGVTLTIPAGACVGVVGSKGAGKSTLLRLLAGLEEPTSGAVVRNARTVMPTTYNRSIQPLLTGRQNARFICRINGNVDDIEERLAGIEKLAMLGNKFDKPVSSYTPGMKASLGFALSMTLDFDVYIADAYNFAGPAAFRSKEAADAGLRQLVERAGLIMSSPKGTGEAVLRQYCRAGIWVHEGKAEWFDDIEDAIQAYKASQPEPSPQKEREAEELPVPEEMRRLRARIKQFGGVLRILMAGLNGKPPTVSAKEGGRLIETAEQIGMTLLTMEQIEERGYCLRKGALPLLKRRLAAAGKEEELYDLESQCDKRGLTT